MSGELKMLDSRKIRQYNSRVGKSGQGKAVVCIAVTVSRIDAKVIMSLAQEYLCGYAARYPEAYLAYKAAQKRKTQYAMSINRRHSHSRQPTRTSRNPKAGFHK
jgi:hypothetical protein